MEAAGDCLSPAARQQAEARLAAKRAARAEAREIRMKELERQQKEEDSERYSRRARRNASASDEDERMSVGSRGSLRIEERPEKDFEKGARTVSSLSAATLASLGGTSSRRGSGDTSISADTEASIREIKDIYELKDQIQDVEGKYMQGLKEMKDSLAEVEEKYKKAMVSNAQLDNEKTNFMYQVDTLKDALLELEEQLAESRRQYEEKSKEFEREKHAHSILQFQFTELKEALKQREEMLAKHGIIPDSDVATNGETTDILENEGPLDSSKNVPGTPQALKSGGDGALGKANEVDMKKEILEDMGKREILQNTEREEHKEESEEQEVQTLHADENAEAEKMVEEHDALSTVMLPDSRFSEQIQSLTEHVSGSATSIDDSDADDLRKETEPAGAAAQQPVVTEAEDHDLNARTDQNSEVDSQMFETAQDMPSVLGTEHELEEGAPKQEEREDLKTSQGLSDNEMDQEADITSESCELVSNQAGLPEVTAAGSLSKDVNVESYAEGLQCSEESAENKVTNTVEEKLVESKDCTDERIDKTGGDRAEEENEVRNTGQGEARETASVGLEGRESCESGVPADTNEKEVGGDQTHTQTVSSEDSPLASSEEQNMHAKTEVEGATAEDGEKEVLMEELETCSDSAETGEQDKASVEAVGCIAEVKGSVLQQTEPDTDVVKEVTTQETSSDPSLSDDKIEESELETEDESGKGKERRTERVEDLKPKVEVPTVECSEETTGDTVGEENTPLEGEVQNVVKQGEGESKEESTVDVGVTTENKVSQETLKENEQELELAEHHGGGDEGANNSQKAEQDENVSEQVKFEGQTEERLEDEGDAFDFDDESKQILETNEKCDGEKADTQKEEGDGANGAVGKTAQTEEARERTDKIETKGALTEDDSLQHEKDEPKETRSLQEEASWKTEEKTNVMEDEIKASDCNEVDKIPDENVLEQDLESAGNNRDESKEDVQGGRRGKGKSRDDCTIS
ncbi:leucine-rich repeat flightless-interacting protein 1 isoform X29 [Balearica regulorum gibbericeps]|uniref:leucine-rich repeat flightless-interacting protein 1 isoform X29 n=1 Tax=Balearica regulorum gibbericeps TaxID=100784 RepID=UPI003F62FF2D